VASVTFSWDGKIMNKVSLSSWCQPDMSQIQVKIMLPAPPCLVCVAVNNICRLKICYLLLCVFMLCLTLLLISAVNVVVLIVYLLIKWCIVLFLVI